jgi:hypothetical protein
MNRLRVRRSGQSGGAAVEFALVMPIFVAVMFGMIDYGWYFYQKFTLAAAIREGVRYGATLKEPTLLAPGPDPYDEAVKEAKKRCDNGSVPGAGVTWTGGLTGIAPARLLGVTGTYTFRPLAGLVPMPKPSMSYSMTMMLEQQY